jgi:hypothetical protein
MTTLRHTYPGTAWLEVTEEDYWYALEVLPPIMLGGGVFQISEAADADSLGRDIHATYVKLGERFFAAELPREEVPDAIKVLVEAEQALRKAAL